MGSSFLAVAYLLDSRQTCPPFRNEGNFSSCRPTGDSAGFPTDRCIELFINKKIQVGYHLLYEAAILFSTIIMTTDEVHTARLIRLHLGKGTPRHDDI
jgi:hypothetical protein